MKGVLRTGIMAGAMLALVGCGESDEANIAATWVLDQSQSLVLTTEGDFQANVKWQPISGKYTLEDGAIVFAYTTRDKPYSTRCGFSFVNEGKGLKIAEPCVLTGSVTGVKYSGILTRG
jgi:hypothetical protein